MNKHQKKTNSQKIVSYSPLITVLFVTIFIIIPLSVVWILSAPEFGNVKITNALWIILIPFLILLISFMLNTILVLVKILNIRSFNFSLPFAFIFSLIIWLSLLPMPFWIKYIIAPIIGILIALVTNIIIGKIEDKIASKSKQK
ncbi:Hypothetical protein, predicted transmembrane protein [Mycoplasmopsis agalactiae 14628]|uniref:Uncharacterized protein n=1 Tax=Mycoplasmopsis agalactiae 14628 TaxID=1110504 RepID=I5D514_MYCAA|nr:Hypothetical protein, predicted transmembrane protein [Mycoplasmopsis agalactiae 14628]